MQDTAPGKDNPPKSPEQLQAMVRQAYFVIPIAPIFSAFDVEEGDQAGLESIKKRLIKKHIEGEIPEIDRFLHQKFDDLLPKASTTQSYTIMIFWLGNYIVSHGRYPNVEDPQRRPELRDDDSGQVAFYQALGLDQENEAGIFSKEGAQQAEGALFEWVIERYGEAVKLVLMKGLDPTDPKVQSEYFAFGEFDLTTLKKFILDWREKFEEHYGKPPLAYLTESEEDAENDLESRDL